MELPEEIQKAQDQGDAYSRRNAELKHQVRQAMIDGVDHTLDDLQIAAEYSFNGMMAEWCYKIVKEWLSCYAMPEPFLMDDAPASGKPTSAGPLSDSTKQEMNPRPFGS